MSALTVEPIRYEALVQDDRIHASLYTDSYIFAEEMEKIFYRGWVFIGHDSEIPQPGDFITRQVGTQPVIMVRGKDDGVSVLLNRCAHRGTTVCPAAQGNARVFTCPYHGWTYDLSGELQGVPYPTGYNGSLDKKANGLTRAPRTASYRGFVFASFSPTGISLEEHLGSAIKLIDRACDLSPEGEIELTAGWVKHRYPANWKMLPENDTDGYHLGFVHLSMLKSVGSQYQRFVGDEKSVKAVLRDWGNGHTEIDWAPGYQQPFEWFGGVSEGMVARYLAAMEASYGKEKTQQRVFDGPPHALIFPNLFLGEMNIAIMQPLNVEECVQLHTPMFLKGVPEFNKRLLRQTEAAMGPASFLLPEDVTIASRNQVGLMTRNAEWLEISRGLNREYVDAEGRRVAHVTDETTNRAFWKHYRKVMTKN
jgi:phenylpropionate dioxygenase-like ring-hydroxylating dioxygenase large terminal subunit